MWGGLGLGMGGGWGSYGGGYLDATFLSYENKNKIDTVWRHLAPDAGTPVCCYSIRDLGLYSRSGKASYHHIWWGLEAMRLDFILIVSLWYLKASNFRAIAKYKPESLSFERILNGKAKVFFQMMKIDVSHQRQYQRGSQSLICKLSGRNYVICCKVYLGISAFNRRSTDINRINQRFIVG